MYKVVAFLFALSTLHFCNSDFILQLKKMQEFLEIEKNNELQQKQEIELSNLHKVSRDQV